LILKQANEKWQADYGALEKEKDEWYNLYKKLEAK